MRTNRQPIEKTVRLSPKGAITQTGKRGSLREAVAQALLAGAERVEVDATDVSYLDAAGLGELVACRAMVEQAGGRFQLYGARGKTRELLALTGLDRILTRHTAHRPIPTLRFRVA